MNRMPGAAGRSGMTLIELLISVALGMLMMTLAWSAFAKSKAAAARTTARVELHQSASVYREFLQRDFANLAPALAFFARSTPQVAVGGDKVDTIEVVCMRTIHPLRTQFSESITEQFMEDHHWVRWRFKRTWRQVDGVWKVVAHALYRSRSTGTRRWYVNRDIIPAGSCWDEASSKTKSNVSDDGSGLLYLNMARPLRDASGGIASLDFNHYNTPDAKVLVVYSGNMKDIGDLTDLDNNEELSSNRVRDFVIGWMDAGGNQVTITSATAATYNIDGLYMDVVGPVGNNYRTQLARRPRVIRIALNLANDTETVSQDFTFSIAAPGLTPQPGP